MLTRIYSNRQLIINPIKTLQILDLPKFNPGSHYRNASTANTMPLLVMKRSEELLCYQQPDEVKTWLNGQELDSMEKEFITNIGTKTNIHDWIKKTFVDHQKKINNSQNSVNRIIPTKIKELTINRQLVLKRLIKTDLKETQTELTTIRKFITDYPQLMKRLQIQTFWSMSTLVTSYVLASLTYDTSSNLVLIGFLTISGIGFVSSALFMTTAKMMNNKYDMLVTDDVILQKYAQKINKLENVLTEFDVNTK